MEQLEIARSEQEGVVTLALKGAVDVQSKEALRAELHDLVNAGIEVIRVDLAGVAYLGSVGLAVLIETSKRLRKKGGRLVVVPGPKQLRKHLALLNLSSVLDFEEALE